jgi:hypothetical protein
MKLDETATAVNQFPINRAFLDINNQREGGKPKEKPLRSEKSAPEMFVHEVTTLSPDRILFNKLEGAIASAHQVAQQIRSVDNTMDQIEQGVQKMKDTLDQVVKSYPPFLLGSNERITQLRQFSSLRKMIDQLTIPPKEDNSPEKILGDVKTYPNAGDWDITTDTSQEKLTINQQPLHMGRGGLDIPDLPVDASDDAIKQALEKLTSAQKNIQEKRQAFIADAHRVIASMI